MRETKRLVLTSDHAAIEMRQAIAQHVTSLGWAPVDIGPVTPDSVAYPAMGEAAARRVAAGEFALGIILCGTGQGIMMAANKVPGIRCGVCMDTFSARMIRAHNDANMLSLGARVIGIGTALDVVEAFLATDFEGGRHATRVDMIGAIETG
jgi:ribose 5-phosphate isomerase B